MATVSANGVVHARAPGKITLFVKVGLFGKGGECELAAAYQAVSLFEDVRAVDSDRFTVSFDRSDTGTGAVSAIRGGAADARVNPWIDVPTDGSNLAIKAARLLARTSGHTGGVHLEITKRVPVAGGMGGAAADAAATLLACEQLWQTGHSKDELASLAQTLGSEVAFAFTGGTAIGSSRDAELNPALAQGQFHWVLALPDFGLDTPAVFEALDAHRNRHILDISPAAERPIVERDVLQAIRAGDCHMLAECLHNDLQAAALQLAPTLADVLESGEENGALVGILTGSGPSIAFLAEDADSSLILHRALTDLGHDAVRVVGPVHGARLVEP